MLLRYPSKSQSIKQFDSKKSEELGDSYLKLPSTMKEFQMLAEQSGPTIKTTSPLILCANDIFQISTLICSNKLTHNGALVGVSWGRMRLFWVKLSN